MTQYIEWLYAKYVGGHAEYPKSTDCRAFLYTDRLELHFWNGDDYNKQPTVVITYQSIKNIENMDEKKISAKRVIALGLVFVPLAIVGAMWKKNHVYTVIGYTDETGPRAIVIDFGKRVADVQSWIYHMMMSHSRASSIMHPKNGSIIYENQRYGFKITYPKTWVRDEFDQKTVDDTMIVEFRMAIESKPPFVTIYLNDLDPNHISFKNFVDEEIKDIKNDHNISILEFSDTTVANISSVKLTDVEYEGYKRMITWVPADNRVYSISYSSNQKEFLDHLPVVESMINSFELTNSTGPKISEVSVETDSKKDSNDDSLIILKRRFAKGEITEEEFVRMHSVLKRAG